MKTLLYRVCLFISMLLLCLICSTQTIAQKKSADDAFNKLEEAYNHYTSDKQLVNDLKPLLTVVKTDTTLFDILNALTSVYTYSYPDTAIVYGQQALELAKKINSDFDLYISYSSLGEALRISGEYARAIEALLKAVPYCERASTKTELAYLNMEIGVCYSDYGDYAKAQNTLYEALSYFKGHLDGSDSTLSATNYIYLAELFERKSQLDSAQYYGNLAYTIDSLRNTNWSWISIVVGDIHAKQNNNSSALGYYKKALMSCQRKDSIDIYNGIAKVFLSGKQTDSAIIYANTALSKATFSSLLKEKLEASIILSNAYKSNNKDSVIKFLQLSIAIKDSVFSQAKAREIQGFYYNDLMRQQELKTAQQSYANKLRLYILIAVLIIILSGAILLLRNNRYKQKAYNLLQKQKQETDGQKQKVETTLNELKSTQAQLIQSEKMASLGELTAGIAHEIQNPLNFVNNFSEVNIDLSNDMNDENDVDEIKAIAQDIKQNSEKILFHGKRADAIVKGMLQHSRQTKGMKESTDINALCDEYLRLSFHGLRAKDKNFNADFKTNFDETIGKINIVPQDVGRVLLNLFNNAFYAVSEKQKTAGESYKPFVSVQTKKINDKVEIVVEDNGNGIPQSIIDKIFQPFFTTKPTGEGTGLGLSLSYDIIKVHGGKLIVNTKVNNGSEFIIELPIKNA